MPHIDFVSEEGAINNARHPAAVSMATVAATFATQHVASAAIGRMLACSDLGAEAQANWTAAWQGATMAGHHDDGRPFTAVLLDQSGGGGALSWHDGPDTGGLPGTPAMGIANVETYEREYPVLYVYRRQARDTGGPGEWRGGVGTEAMMVPHRNDGAIDLTVLTHGASQPESQGLYGGYPSSVQVRLLLRGSDVRKRFADGDVPTDIAAIGRDRLEPLAAKQRTPVAPDDAIVMACAGGGGFGDPILRPPESVRRDVERGLCSAAVAGEIYGVVLTDGDGVPAVDESASEAARENIRARRLADGRPVSDGAGGASAGATAPSQDIGSALKIVGSGDQARFQCARCDHTLGAAGNDPKLGALARELPIDRFSAWNEYGLVNEIVVREFCCPSCAHLIGVAVCRPGDPVLEDTHLAAPGLRQAAE
jgi:N-methylhydantoinase B